MKSSIMIVSLLIAGTKAPFQLYGNLCVRIQLGLIAVYLLRYTEPFEFWEWDRKLDDNALGAFLCKPQCRTARRSRQVLNYLWKPR